MELPLQVSFHNMPHSDGIVGQIIERAELLEEFAGDLSSCRLVVDVPHRHARSPVSCVLGISLGAAQE